MEALGYLGVFILSLGVLVKSSDWFVESAEEIGLSFGISPFIVGVTIVAFGTSLPELASSVAAVLAEESEIVIGNVVGSNIANFCLVLGLVAVISKNIIIEKRVMEIDVPILFASAFMLWFMVSDLQIVWWEGLFMLVGLVVFLFNSFKPSEPETEDENAEKAESVRVKTYVMLLVGGVLVWLSAVTVVHSIQFLSEYAGISPEIIAVTLVAIGTSLPEVVVSIAAARRGNAGIAVGNVLGSNIFNTFAVISIPSFITPLVIPADIVAFSLPFMLMITGLFAVICVTSKVSRWEGYFFLLLYAYFMCELVADILAKG